MSVSRAPDESEMPIWAKNLQRLTEKSGLSQAELARRAGISRDAFNRYHRGITKIPLNKLHALAAIFEVRPIDIDPMLQGIKNALPMQLPPPSPFELLQSASGDRSKAHLKVDLDLPIAKAVRIIEILHEDE